ncbi:TatD family hydrolase [Basfia succiniciproducens]|uniref:TatD family hydrolase n=1 Tax=Basfia succiniciproducens TaxID=653940 RepID=UPI0008B794AC|nr:TatD family hydrolase [Basfia succiniciproducens]SEP67226.1 TatD DNase family protein [Basfia succiniciproducens]
MAFFDTHTHLDYLQRTTNTPLSALMENALNADVRKILIVAVMARDFENILNMTELFPRHLYCGLGLHPLFIKNHQKSHLNELETYLKKNPQNLTALSEIGLERSVSELISDELWRKQCDFLEAQLYLAKQYKLPVNLHSRKSHDQLFTFLKRIRLPKCGVLHGFSGSYQQAKNFVDLGYKIGVGGVISYLRANKTRQAIAKLSLDSLLLETDTPDMPVFGFQGEANRPERLVQTFRYLCELRSEPPAQIQQQIWRNSCEMFAVK